MKEVQLIEGGWTVDDRGSVRFVASERLRQMKRCYVVENFSVNTVRAWHGHRQEAKLVWIQRGSALVLAVPLKKAERPRQDIVPQRFVLSSMKPALLYIPGGYAHGWRALTPATSLFFFSSATLEESQADDLRLPWDYWGSAIWDAVNR